MFQDHQQETRSDSDAPANGASEGGPFAARAHEQVTGTAAVGSGEPGAEREREAKGGASFPWAARMLEDCSKVFGLAFLGSGANVIFILALAAVQVTTWKALLELGEGSRVSVPEPDLVGAQERSACSGHRAANLY